MTTPKPRRLNPLCLPSETEGRFVMLTLTVVMIVWPLTMIGYMSTRDFGLLFQQTSQLNRDVQQEQPTMLDLDDAQLARGFEQTLTLVPQILWYSGVLSTMSIGLGTIGILLVNARRRYRNHIRRIYQQNHLGLTDYTNSDVIMLTNMVNQLADDIGLKPPPQLVFDVWKAPGGGRMLGFPHKHVLLLTGLPNSIVSWVQEDPGRFKALVLHELGHANNKDIRPTFLAQEIWTTFLVLIPGLLVFFLGLLTLFNEQIWSRGGSVVFLVITCVQIALILGVTKTIWQGILRTRENYADWFAGLWGLDQPLVDLLQEEEASEKKKEQATGLFFWQRWRWTKLHPSPIARIKLLQNPRGLFDIAWDLPIITGILLAMVVTSLPIAMAIVIVPLMQLIELGVMAVGLLLLGLPSPLDYILFFVLFLFVRLTLLLLAGLSPFFIIAFLTVKTIGTQVQRTTIADMVEGKNDIQGYVQLIVPALLLSLGFLIGLYITPASFLAPWGLTAVLLTPIWFVVFSLSTWLWLAFARAFTKVAMGSRAGSIPPRRYTFVINMFTSVSAMFYYIPALFVVFAVKSLTISFPAEVIPTGMSMLEFYITMFVTSIVVLTSIALVWALASMGAVLVMHVWVQFLSDARCPECNGKIKRGFVIGRQCELCGSELADWVYVNERQLSDLSQQLASNPQGHP